MRFTRTRKVGAGFANPPELLIVLAVLVVVAAVILPVAVKRGWGVLATAGMIVGGLGVFVLWLQHRNIIDWLRGRRRRDIGDDKHDA